MEISVNNSNFRGCRTSALEACKRCPFSVQKVYRDKLKGYIATSALRGTAVHNALEDYGRHCLENKCATDLDYWDSIIYKYAATVPSEVYQETLDILIDSREFINYKILLDAKIASIEERFYLDQDLNVYTPESGKEEEAYFSSAIDYYMIEEDETIANVFDFKTARKIFSATVLKTKLQKDYYPFLIFQAYPKVQTIRFYFEFARYGVLTDPIIVTREEDWERLRKQLVADIEEYYQVVGTQEDLQARPSGFCQLCEVQGVCPSVNNALAYDVKITDKDSAIECARQLKALEIKMKQVKESLNLYLEFRSNIELSKTEGYGLQETNKESVYDVFHLVLDLEAAKVPPGKIFDALKMTKANYLKLIKPTKIPKEKYLVSKPGTKTSFYDLGEDEEDHGGEEE
jgi:hypothetical protein